MLRLVEDIIDFSLMQTGQLLPEYSECDFSRLIKDLVSIFRNKAAREKQGLSIITDIPDSQPVMFTDERKLTQILMKLLENSYKFTEKGQIRIGIVSVTEKEITFSVEDSGNGIEAGNIDRIFDQFFFVSEDDSMQASRGSGLGLAFAKTVTELMGGKIWAEKSKTTGLIFYFSLPNQKPDILALKPHSSKTPGQFYWPGKHIVVAEDEESNFLLIEAILKDTGIVLIRANDGVELLEILEKETNIDLVLLDIKMPRMNGINAMKILRNSKPGIPVIAQTAYDQTQHREQCREQGCEDFLVKPIRKIELLEAIKRCLG